MNRKHLMSGGRYPVLRALAILYLLASALVLIGGIIVAGYILATQPWQITTRVVWAIVSLVGTFFGVLGCFAVAEVIKLFIDIEHNTRQSSMIVTTPAPSMPAGVSVGTEGSAAVVHRNRLDMLDEETAEAALIRGH